MPPTLLQKGNIVSDDPNLKYVVPITHIIDWFKQRLSSSGIINRVLILNATTGAGKTTVLPPYLYDLLSEKTIIVTQPRILTAIKNAQEIASTGFYPKMKLGETIGFQTSVERFRHKKRRGVLFVTVGVLTMHFKLLTDTELMNKYSAILIDEIHEMSVELAELLLKIKEFLVRNKDNPQLPFVVCMSATIDEQRYMDYFNVGKENFISITGLTYNRKTHWALNQSVGMYPMVISTIIREISERVDDKKNCGDVLVFLPNKMAMLEIAGKINELNKLNATNKRLDQLLMPLMLDRPTIITEGYDYKAAFRPVESLRIYITINGKKEQFTPARKIIMSTSVAETGLTIDTLKYVVDWGYHRSNEFYPSIGAYCLLNKPAAQSRIVQRIGRIGRKFPGEFYAAYTEEMFEKLQKQQFSDLILSDSTAIILNFLKPDVPFYPGKLDLIENLSPDSIHYAIEKCYAVGFCDSMGRLTKLGEIGAKFSQIRIEIIRMILSGYFWGANILDLITIAGGLMLSVSNELKSDRNKSIDWVHIYKNSMKKFMLDGSADHIYLRIKLLISDDFINFIFLFHAVGNIIKTTNMHSELIRFCDKVNIKYSAITTLIRNRDDLIDQMLNIELNLFGDDSRPRLVEIAKGEDFMDAIVRLKYCIYDGFRLNLAKFSENTMRYNVSSGDIITPDFIADNSIAQTLENKYGISKKCSPTNILYSSLSLNYNPHTKLYDKRVDYVSTLDGFVKIDDDFL